MKIGILTFHCAVNYGAVLQAYGLKEIIRSLGHEVAVIDYRPDYITNFYRIWREQRPGFRSLANADGWNSWLRYIKVALRRSNRNRKFKRFINNNFVLEKFIPEEITKKYDVIICGSDQIWNPEITGSNLDKVFFGEFAKNTNSRLVSYAASAGSVERLYGFEREFLRLLNNFDSLSVREQQLSAYISSYSPVDNFCVVDPVALAGRKVFESICLKRLVQKPYLLYFDLVNNPLFRRAAKDLAHDKGLVFIELTTYHDIVPGQKLFPAASPEEFCTLFRDAEFVACSSFHGMLFSIIFERDFITYCHRKQGVDRMVNLLEKLEIKRRLIIESDDSLSLHSHIYNPIDYHAVNIRLGNLRCQSIEWLKNALS